MAVGKQVAAYLKGKTAQAFVQLMESRGVSAYALVTEAVEALLVKEGLLEEKKRTGLNPEYLARYGSAVKEEPARRVRRGRRTRA